MPGSAEEAVNVPGQPNDNVELPLATPSAGAPPAPPGASTSLDFPAPPDWVDPDAAVPTGAAGSSSPAPAPGYLPSVENPRAAVDFVAAAAVDAVDAPVLGAISLAIQRESVLPAVEAVRPTLLRAEQPALVLRELPTGQPEGFAAHGDSVVSTPPPAVQRDALAAAPSPPTATTAITPNEAPVPAPQTTNARVGAAGLLGERPIEGATATEPSSSPGVEVTRASGPPTVPLDLQTPTAPPSGRRGLGAPLEALPETAASLYSATPAVPPELAAIQLSLQRAALTREPDLLAAPVAGMSPPATRSPAPTGTPLAEGAPVNVEPFGPAATGPGVQADHDAPPIAVPMLGARPLDISLHGEGHSESQAGAEIAAPSNSPALQLLPLGERTSRPEGAGDTRPAPVTWPWRAAPAVSSAPSPASPAVQRQDLLGALLSSGSSAAVGASGLGLTPGVASPGQAPVQRQNSPTSGAIGTAPVVTPTFLTPGVSSTPRPVSPVAPPGPTTREGGPEMVLPALQRLERDREPASEVVPELVLPRPFDSADGADPGAATDLPVTQTFAGGGPINPPSPAVSVPLDPFVGATPGGDSLAARGAAPASLRRSQAATSVPTGSPVAPTWGSPNAMGSPRATMTLLAPAPPEVGPLPVQRQVSPSTPVEGPDLSVQSLSLASHPHTASSTAHAPGPAGAPAGQTLVRSGTQQAEPPTVQRFLGQMAMDFIGNPFAKKKPKPEEEETTEEAPDETGAAAGAGEMSTNEVRTLATRIYPFISQKLKAEFGRDRERAGMITGLHR